MVLYSSASHIVAMSICYHLIGMALSSCNCVVVAVAKTRRQRSSRRGTWLTLRVSRVAIDFSHHSLCTVLSSPSINTEHAWCHQIAYKLVTPSVFPHYSRTVVYTTRGTRHWRFSNNLFDLLTVVVSVRRMKHSVAPVPSGQWLHARHTSP